MKLAQMHFFRLHIKGHFTFFIMRMLAVSIIHDTTFFVLFVLFFVVVEITDIIITHLGLKFNSSI